MIALTVPLVIAGVSVALLALGALVDDRRARRKRDEEIQPPLEAVLPLLHSINDDRCIGCEACVDVCPTEVLELVEHKVRVMRFSDCVQCEQCQNACPTTALVMYRDGTAPRMLTVPELDEHFQTGTPGQYLIGEVAGKPLVKNAANLGRAVVEHIARQLEPGRDKAILDVAIVGSGPGGLSAGLTCLRRGLSCVVLEKEHVISSTVSRYPKGKHFMAEPSNAINASFLPVFDATKEELVAAWQQVVAAVKLPIKLGEAVENVKRGDDGIFEVKTTVGTYRARRVVLATGLRGKPRLLAVPGANLEKVQSLLDDPGEFAGLDVLVVGGGDSAVEGAMSLADVGARVVLSYRGDGFKRCKQGNQKRLAEMTSAGKLEVLLESNVKEFTADAVAIKLKDGTVKSYPNQRAFVLIGADTPVAWLEQNNVRFVERPHLYTLGASDEVVKRLVPDATECPRSAAESIALVLGQRQTPVPAAKPHRVRDLVAELRDEFRDAVHELSGVFKVSDLAPPPRKKVGSRTEPTAVISPGQLARARTNIERARTNAEHARTGAQRAPTNAEWGEQRTQTRANPWSPERTIVGTAPLRPRSHKMPPPPPRRANIGFDTSDLAAFDSKLPFADRTEPVPALVEKTTSEPHAYDDENATIVDGRRLR